MVAVIFHRGRNRQAHYTHGTGRRDRLAAAVAGAVVLFGIDAVAVVRSHGQLLRGVWNFPDDDPHAFRVQVTARQWAWTFRTPGADGQFNTTDDVVTLNRLHAPVGRPVLMQLTSKDVVHSMYLPNFRTKIDAVPGTVTRMWFQARETGLFEIGCTQHCGAWHYKMRGELLVMEQDAYRRWAGRAAEDTALRAAAAAAGPTTATTGGATTATEEGWPWNPVP
jgi:cytochrome c oxidase subunit 2